MTKMRRNKNGNPTMMCFTMEIQRYIYVKTLNVVAVGETNEPNDYFQPTTQFVKGHLV